MNFAGIVLDSGVRLTVPLLLAAMGELISERAGIMNVGLEGMMTAGAFGGYLAAVAGAGLPLAIGVALVVGALAGLLMAFGTVWMKGNPILVGFALFILLPGLANFMFVQEQAAQATPAVPDLSLPLLSSLPLLGKALFSQNIFYYLAVALTVIVWGLFARTRTGLVLSSVGHDPAKAGTKGISVAMVRTQALLACGALAGLGGAALSLGSIGSYTPDIIGGRGFIAVAIVILGRWTVVGAVAGAALMGLLEALQLNLSQVSNIPVQLLGALPWAVVIVMLILATGCGRMRREPCPFERSLA